MAANLVNEDLWEKVILQAGPGEIPALNREMAAALRRDTLYKTFAARRAPRLWGALGAAPPGRDRFRRAVLLESDMVGPVGPRGTVALQPWTCIVVVTQGDAEVFRARCPFDGDAAWNPGAPWEGLVSSFELHASNRPAAVDWSKRESRRSLTELHSWIFQLAWR